MHFQSMFISRAGPANVDTPLLLQASIVVTDKRGHADRPKLATRRPFEVYNTISQHHAQLPEWGRLGETGEAPSPSAIDNVAWMQNQRS